MNFLRLSLETHESRSFRPGNQELKRGPRVAFFLSVERGHECQTQFKVAHDEAMNSDVEIEMIV